MDEFREVTKMIMSEIDKDINVPNKNDSISRQAALEAIKKLEKPAPTAQHLSAIFDCEDTIKALPYAQLAQDLPNGCTDTISRQAAIDALAEGITLRRICITLITTITVRTAVRE